MGIIVKLNDPAGNFFDSSNGQSLSGADVAELIETERVSLAIKNGHLRKASEQEIKEFKAAQKAAADAGKVDNAKKPTKDELAAQKAAADAKRIADEEAARGSDPNQNPPA